MKNTLKYGSLLFLCTLLTTGCDPTFSNKTFVKGKVVFDLSEEGELPEEISVEDMEDVFKKESDGYSFANELELPIINNQLFIADVNCDGKKDICYKYYSKTKTEETNDLIIYDYENAKVLYRKTTLNTDFSKIFKEGMYFFSLDENEELIVKHSLQTLYFPKTNEDDDEEEDSEDRSVRCVDENVKFAISKDGIVREENVELPFSIVNVSTNTVTKGETPGSYICNIGTRFEFANQDEEVLFCFRIDYEGNYTSDSLDQNDIHFLDVGENENKQYDLTFLADCNGTKPFITRVYKAKFYVDGDFDMKIKVKGKKYTFHLSVV